MKLKFWMRNKIFWALIFTLGLALVCIEGAGSSQASSDRDPVVAGQRAAHWVMSRNWFYNDPINLIIGPADSYYQTVCARYGVLIFADATGNKNLLLKVQQAYQPFLTGKRHPNTGHVDLNVFGIVPFELYRQTSDSRYLPLAKMLADDEFKGSRADGLSDYTRFWVDDMYMVGSLQVQAYKSLKDPVYLDRAAVQLLAYIDKLQQPNGLFYHTPGTPFFWARGNGWASAAMTEWLLSADDAHPKKAEIFKAYKKMMDALIELQDENGLWHQLLDEPESYIESSGSGMFIFALATGVRKGWLPDQPFRSALEKAWNALSEYLDAEGRVQEVCVGTAALPSKSYYMTRPSKSGDMHGQAGFLWASTAIYLLEKEKSQ